MENNSNNKSKIVGLVTLFFLVGAAIGYGGGHYLQVQFSSSEASTGVGHSKCAPALPAGGTPNCAMSGGHEVCFNNSCTAITSIDGQVLK